jgi:putative membrane-bound dehydrogenase-like protein
MMKYCFFTSTLCVCLILSISCKQRESTPAGFQIEEGFELALVASEPNIKDPVDLEFSENGDALVLEMPGYPFEDQQSKIILLKDKDQDGVYDDHIVFAENLQLASSIMPYKKGVLVAAPPYLLFVKDTDNDYKADVVDTLMGGFSTGNLQHNYNGLTYGLDNWIYAVNGGNSGKPYWWGDTTTMIDLRGQDFRFNLEKRTMERIGESSGGFSLGMDDAGHLYETHNLIHIAHLVFPERYQREVRLPIEHSLSIISDHEEDGLSRIYPIGEQESRVNHPEQSGYFSGSCGITYYGGGAFGAEYDNTVWVADVVLNLVHVDKIEPKGASLVASRIAEKRDFLASTDRSFRPVNMTVGPDGNMYLIDMYRQVIEHPEWIPDDLEKDLDLHAGKDKGRIYRISKANSSGASFTIDQLKTVEGMIMSLSHTNQWVRRTAHRLLMETDLSQDQLLNLSNLLTSELPMARLHALWILDGKTQLSSAQIITALADASPAVRENALIVSEQLVTTDVAVLNKVLTLTSDVDQRVRMQAALSLSTLPQASFIQYKEQIFDALQMASSKPMDTWNVSGITLAAKYSPAEFFKKHSASSKMVSPELLGSLAAIAGSSSQNTVLILNTLVESPVSADSKRTILDQLTQGIHYSGTTAGAIGSIQKLEKSGDLAIISSLASLRKKLQLPASQEFLTYSREALKKVVDKSLPDSIRFKQMSLLALLPYKAKSEVLFQCLDNTEPVKLQEAALRQLAEYPEPEIGARLVSRWASLGPQIRKWAGDLLLYREIYNDALLTGLENGTINIGEMNFDLERRRQLLWWTDNENTKRRAEALFSDSGVSTRKEAMDKMKEALTLSGTSVKGALVFKSMCSTCHKYGSEGQEVGPVLTEINRKSKESLMHDIIDPNAAVNTQYINHRLETKTGDIHMGIVENETDQYVTIKKMGGDKVTVYKNDIKNFTSLGTSLMMEGLEGNMTTQDMADLLAYLQNSN